MSCGNQSDINQTFIIEPVTSESVLSGCNGIYTNILSSCSGDTSILLGTGGIFINGNITGTTYYGDGSNLTGIISAFRPDVGAFTLVSLQDDVNFPNVALGDFGFAIGQSTQANGFASYAEGSATIAGGDYSHAEGQGSIANGQASHAEGLQNQANNIASHAGGFQSIANGDYSFVHGFGSIVNGLNSVVLGANLTGVSDNTTYVDNFNIRTIGSASPVIILGVDIDGNVVSGTTAVSTGTTLNINGNEYDLSASREWVVAQGSTGVLEYAGALKNTDTTIDVGPVKGYIIDNESNPLVPSFIFLDYSGETGVTVTTIGGGLNSYVLLKPDNTILFQNTVPTSQERKQNILLSKIAHADGIVNLVVDEPDFILSPVAQLRDLFKPIKYINDKVFPFPNGANLFVNISGGFIFGNGVNFVLDNENPNQVAVGPDTPMSFVYRTQTGGTAVSVSAITPGFYDVDGVVTPVPSASTTIQWIFSIPSDGFVVQYGQTLYPLITEAVAAVGKENFTVFSDLTENAILIGVLIVESTATDLSDTLQARFLRADKFGQIAGSQAGISTSTLQGAYNNSTQPQLVISPTGGALQIKGFGEPNNSLFQGLDSGDTVTFNINNDGSLTANTITVNTISATTYFGLPLDVFVTGGTLTSGTTTFTNNSGGTFDVTGYTFIPHLEYNNTNSTVWNNGFGNDTTNLSFGQDALVSKATTANTYNVALGYRVLSANTTGSFNVGIGAEVLTNNLTGDYNFGLGASALNANIFGTQNLALGSFALAFSTGGSRNTAVGIAALQNGTSPSRNVAIGNFTLYVNSAQRNIAIGQNAGGQATGNDNTFIGSDGASSTTGLIQGDNNTFIGKNVTGILTGSNNTLIGKVSSLSSTTNNNVVIANGAGVVLFKDDNTSTFLPRIAGATTRIVTVGVGGLLSSTTISSITFSGGAVTGATYYANGLSANTISATTYLGLPTDIRVTGGTYTAGTTTFTNNTGGTFNVTGFISTDIFVTGGTYTAGTTTLTNKTGGTFNVTGFTYIPHLEYDNLKKTVWNNGAGNIYENTSFGESALTSNISGFDNVAIGTETLAKMVNGNSNVGVGAFVLSNNVSGSSNTGVGDGALYSGTGSFNTLIGAGAGLNMTTPNSNTGVGAGVMQNLRTGIRNTAMGDTALGGSGAGSTGVTGNFNIALGFKAGNAVTSGSGNILIENKSGNTVGGVTVGHNNIIIDNVDKSGIVIGSGNTIIGGFNNTIADGSNQVIIGTGYGVKRVEIDSAGATKIYGSLSATTYLGLPTDVFVTGGTFSSSSSTIIFTNNTGGTFNVTGISASGSSSGGTGGSGVSLTTTITINGVSQNLAANREWLTLQGNTGILNFNSGLTLNNSTAGTINIAAMYGYIVDNETNPAIPTFIFVNYTGSPTSGVTVTTRNSGQASYLLLTSSGIPFFQNTFPTSADRKQKIWLGKIAHPASGTITTVINEPDFLTSPQSQVSDFFQAINYINDGVYPYFSGANLSFNITNGNIHGNGINLHNSRLIPNELQMGPISTGTSFVYRTRTGGTSTAVSAITPGFYDNNGIITAVGGGVNTSTVQWIFAVPGAGFVVQYGQIQYTTLANAIAAIGREQFVVFPNLIENAILIGVLAVNKNATNLSDSTQGQFFRSDKFGQIIGAAAGVSTTNLQAAYDNSSAPQITTSLANGALQLKAPAPSTPILQGITSLGVTAFTLNGGGALTTTLVSATTYVNLPFITGGTVTSGGNATFTTNTGFSFSVSGFQTTARLQNNMNFDGTGNLYPSVDAVNVQANQIFLASLETGMINRDGTFRMAINNPTTIGITGTTEGVLIRSLITTPPIAPSSAIKQIPNSTLLTSSISLGGNGRYVRFLGYDYSTNSIVNSTTDFNNSDTIAHLGYVELLRSGVTNTILALSTNPEIAGYDNLTQLTAGYQTDVNIRPNPNLNVNSTLGTLRGMSVNWDGINNDLKIIPSNGSVSFARIDPNYLVTTVGYVPTTGVTTTDYWNGSALVTIPNGSNATIQRFIMMLDGRIFLQAGEGFYTSKAKADEAIIDGTFTFSPIFPPNTFVVLALLSANKNTTDLTDTTKAQIYDITNGFSNGGSGGAIPTLQNVYDVSSPNQILTDSTNGALTIKNGSGSADTQSFLYEGVNSGGTRTSFIRADGAISGTTYFGIPFWSAGTGLNAVSQKFCDNIASGEYSVAEGFNTVASGDAGAHAEGSDSKALGNASHAEGGLTTASGLASHAEGFFSDSVGNYSHAEGNDTTASGESSHSEGQFTIAGGTASHAEGVNTIAIGRSSHVEGEENFAYGDQSHAEGLDTQAIGVGSHAEGISNFAIGEGSHAEGIGVTVRGTYSHAEGAETLAGGTLGAHAEGFQSAASGESSHAEGRMTIARGNYSHAEGLETQNDGVASHVEGFNTYASGGAAHAEGAGTTATGNQSHAEGTNTTSGGENSHAGGLTSSANGFNSFVHGSGSTAGGTNTIVLGGNIIGNTDNTTYVDNLNIKTIGGGTPVTGLGVDVNGNVVADTGGGGDPDAIDYFYVVSFRGLYNF